jgi:hypothetical protein
VNRIAWPLMLVLLVTTAARAQSPAPIPEDKDHAIVFELGWAGDWSRDEGTHPKGATFAFEVTPIEHWLELEFGVSAVRADGVTEVPLDVLFKKPWQFSPQFEFMVGVGPEVIHASGARSQTYWGISSVVDLMFWPTKDIGWYLEPAYEVTFHDGSAHHGLAMAAGLIIGR